MKRITLLVVCFLAIGVYQLYGQAYLDLILNPNENTTLQEVQTLAEAYFEGKDKGKGSGYKQYKRWEYKMERRVNADGKIQNHTRRAWDVIAKLNSSNPPVQKSMMGNWTNLGPTSFTKGPQGYNGGLGRINVVAFHPTDANTIYVGGPAGGVWKTTDGGNSWAPMSDMLASIGVSGIAVDHANPNTVYILTGDGDGADTYSIGVMKSTDGGNTWSPTGLTWGVTNFVRGYKLLMHPTNSNIQFVVTTVGILKTTDGWATWNSVNGASFRDIEFKPGDPTTVYACTTNSFFKSTDTGNSWTVMNTGLPFGENRCAIAVSPANPNYVYYLAGPGGASGGGTFNGLYRSTDSGATFSTRATTPNILGNSSTGSGTSDQSWYDIAMAISPTNAEVTITGGVNVWRSTNGGTTNNIIAHWNQNAGGFEYTHADIHDLVYNPVDNVLYCGSDGGVSKSTDNGLNWTNIWDGLEIMQFYRIAGIESDPNLILGGTQDNGSNKYTGNPDILHILGGDGMDCMIDYNTSNTMYYSFQNGGLQRSLDGGNTRTGIQPGGSTGSWVTPYGMDASDPNIIYGGYSDVYRSTNQGNTWTNLGADGRGALAVGINDGARLYASNGSTIQTSANTGGSWTNISAGLPGLTITFIAVDPADANRVWVTLGGYTAGQKVYESTNAGATWTNISGTLPNIPALSIAYQNTGGTPADAIYVGMDVGVYYRSDVTPWTLHNTGLPNVPVRDLEINHANNKIRAGTYGRGLWETPLFGSAAPPNDLCTGAAPIMCGQNITGTTVGAGADTAPFCGTGDGTGGGLWYTFTGDGSEVTLSTCNAGTDYDTKLRVYTGSCAALVCVAGDDDDFGCGFSFLRSTVTFNSIPGTIYYVLVHGFSGAEGDFELSMTCVTGPPNDLCANAEPVACGASVIVDITGASGTDNPGTCVTFGSAEPGVWYTVTGTGGNINITTCNPGTNYDTKITVWEGTCGALNCVTGNDDQTGGFDPACNVIGIGFNRGSTVDFCSTPGQTYYVYLYGFAGNVGIAEMSVTCDPALAVTCPPADLGVFPCGAPFPPAANSVASFIALGGTVTGGCSPTVTSVDDITGDVCTGLMLTRTYTIEDANNSFECIQTASTLPPTLTITCPADITAECIDQVTLDPNDAVVVSDCGINFSVYIKNPYITGVPGCDGTIYEYVYVAVDDCGNTAECTQEVMIVNTPATISVPPGGLVECYEDIDISLNDATVENVCADYNLYLVPPVVNGELGCPGTTYTFVYRVVDACGNIIEEPVVFTNITNAGPTIEAPADITCECLAGVNPNPDHATVTTSCTIGSEVTVSGPQIFGPMDCPGTVYRYTYTVTDDCGRMATDVQDFIVSNGPPVFENCPEDNWLVLNCEDFGGEDGTIQVIDAWIASVTASSSCGVPLTVSNNFNPFNFNTCITGITTVTFLATDNCGRTSLCNGTIIVNDTEAPEIITEAQDHYEMCNYNTPDNFDDWVDELGGAVAYDGCSGDNVTWAVSPGNPSINCAGSMGTTAVPVTFIVTDNCGNKTSTTATFYALMGGGDLIDPNDNDELEDRAKIVLDQNRPNPFKNETLISFSLPEAAEAILTIYDLNGKTLKTIEGDFAQGYNEVSINRSDLGGPGVLYYTLRSQGEMAAKIMILMD